MNRSPGWKTSRKGQKPCGQRTWPPASVSRGYEWQKASTCHCPHLEAALCIILLDPGPTGLLVLHPDIVRTRQGEWAWPEGRSPVRREGSISRTSQFPPAGCDSPREKTSNKCHSRTAFLHPGRSHTHLSCPARR